MKTFAEITNGEPDDPIYLRIVLTPESEAERAILKMVRYETATADVAPQDSSAIELKMWVNRKE